MRQFIIGFLMLGLSSSGFAQQPASYQEVKQSIETFFEGFHARDSVIINSVVSDGVIFQSIVKNEQGETELRQVNYGKFLNSIVSIPLETNFREKIHSYTIKVDGALANVWTPYSFFIDGVLSHCGVNNFQLFEDNGKWEIISIVDTRRKEDCEGES